MKTELYSLVCPVQMLQNADIEISYKAKLKKLNTLTSENPELLTATFNCFYAFREAVDLLDYYNIEHASIQSKKFTILGTSHYIDIKPDGTFKLKFANELRTLTK